MISDHDHQQEEQFLRRSEHDDVDVNISSLSFHPVVKDAGDSNVSAGDVVRSSKVHLEQNGDRQSKVRCSSSLDMTCVKSCQQYEAHSQKYFFWMLLDRGRCEDYFSSCIIAWLKGTLLSTFIFVVTLGFHEQRNTVASEEGCSRASLSSETLGS